MKTFNANCQLQGFIAGQLAPHLTLRPLVVHRYKATGAMMSSGKYVWGPYELEDDGHYQDGATERLWSLKRYRNKDVHWHLAADADGKVWFSPSGFFYSATPISSITDWELTEMELD